MLISEQQTTGSEEQEIWDQLQKRYQVMAVAVQRGSEGDGVHSATGLTGGEAVKLKKIPANANNTFGQIFFNGGPISCSHQRS